MCGIVGAVAERDVVPVLIEGLRRLEYRGYDSAGIAVIGSDGRLERRRVLGKVARLEQKLSEKPLHGAVGIAHTRWATHGAPHERNAHPHLSGESVALVHNGIIENYARLREALMQLGYRFSSETDTEVLAHRLQQELSTDSSPLAAMGHMVSELEGAYACAAVHSNNPDRLVVARQGCPLVIGLGIGENFIASDLTALLPVTHRFMFLEEGDIAEIFRDRVTIHDRTGNPVERTIHESALTADQAERGNYRHFMLKEIHEQPRVIADTLNERVSENHALAASFGPAAQDLLKHVKHVHLVACGTSYHAAVIASHFIEGLARIPARAEIASEYRYRNPVVPEGGLFVAVSQSGETADTLAALRMAKSLGYTAFLSICNVPESSLMRESEMALLTRAGPEIGVASTKAFTTQLVAMMLLALVLGRDRNMTADEEIDCVRQLRTLPAQVEKTLQLNNIIRDLATQIADKQHALFLGRGIHHAVAMEGALKLKEISYIHAEAYPAGELKHGPLALVDSDMPVVAVAPNNTLLEKIKSNLEEVRARGGRLYVFTDPASGMNSQPGIEIVRVPAQGGELTDAVTYTIPLQLLAYHVAVLRGTDVDQPRNLAKSVTVE